MNVIILGTQEKSPSDATNEDDNNDDNNEFPGLAVGGASNANVPPIINELLCYVQFHMRQTAKELIAEVIKRFYSDVEVMEARDVLQKAYDGQFVYKMKTRRDTKPTATQKGKSKFESFIEDILCVMYELDKNRIVTGICATNLARLPKCDPKEVDPYSNLQLILDLKERVMNLEDSSGSMHAQLLSHDEHFKEKSKKINDHETTLTNHEVAITNIDTCIKHIAYEYPKAFANISKGNSGNDNTGSKNNDSAKGGNEANDSLVNNVSSGNNGGSYAGVAATASASGSIPSVAPLPNQVASSLAPLPKQAAQALTPLPNHVTPNSTLGNPGLGQSTLGQGASNSNNANGVNRRNSNGMNRPWTNVGRNNGPRRGSNNWQGNRNNFQQSGRNKFLGTATNTKFSGGDPPKRDFFISRIKSNTDEQDIREHLYCNGIKDFELYQTSNVLSTFKSFKLTVNLPDRDKVLSPDLWPTGVCVDRYRERNNRVQFSNNYA